MELEKHILFSLILSIFFYSIDVPAFFILTFFISSVLIDLDHLLDYFISFPNELFRPIYFISSRIKYFFSLDWYSVNKKIVFLHSIELLLILSIINLFINSNLLFFVIFGFSFHLTLDVVYNTLLMDNTPFLFYFFTYRFFKGFNYPKNL
ncbi:MAG: hypothetical protein ACOCP4_00410 [Candidatus Woesearchaeota archaeon]